MSLDPDVALYRQGGLGERSSVLASSDLERELAYSEICPIRLSILIFTDSLDVVTGAMNKGVGVFAESSLVSSSWYHSICHSGHVAWDHSAGPGSVCISHPEPGPVGSDRAPA